MMNSDQHNKVYTMSKGEDWLRSFENRHGEIEDRNVKSIILRLPKILGSVINREDDPRGSLQALNSIMNNNLEEESSKINLLQHLILAGQEGEVRRESGRNLLFYMRLNRLNIPPQEQDHNLLKVANFLTQKIEKAMVAIRSTIEAEEDIENLPNSSVSVNNSYKRLQSDQTQSSL